MSGVFETNYIISVRNVGYVRAAGRVLKEAFGSIGSAGGHASMAKAIIPLTEFHHRSNIDPRSIRQMDRKAQQLFLRALHSAK